jgi:hypothetical protein
MLKLIWNYINPNGFAVRILIFIHPGFRIQQQHRESRGKFFCPTIFCCHKYHKIVNNFIFEQVKIIFLAQILRIIVLLTQQFVIKLSKIWVWDLRSGIRKKSIPGTGSWIQGQKDSGFATLLPLLIF